MVKILFIESSLSDRLLIQSRVPDFSTVITVSNFSEAESIISSTVIDIFLAGPSLSESELKILLEGFISETGPSLLICRKKEENPSEKNLFRDKRFIIPDDLDKLGEQLDTIVRQRLKSISAVDTYNLNRMMSRLVGSSDKIMKVKEEILCLCNAPGSLLIVGESGTGKEIVAGLLHDFSNRKQGPFHAVNAGAIPPELSASEFFGAAHGAYTGAVDRHGCFEHANGGTLFLDEIAEIDPSVQVELLRTLETGMVKKLGTNNLKKIDVRLICATNKNLYEEAEAGRFRRDLLFRIDEFRISIPPLRERKEDIPDLLMHFSEQLGRERPNKRYHFSDSFIDRLYDHDWPGNVRELRNVFRRAVYAADSGVLTSDSIEYGY